MARYIPPKPNLLNLLPAMESQASPTENTLIDVLHCQHMQETWNLVENSPESTIGSLLEFNIRASAGAYIHFLPKVEDLEKNEQLCKKLSTHFHIPPFFWKRTSWDANGFFGSQFDPIRHSEVHSHCSYLRFLIKEIAQSPTTMPRLGPPKYNWQYLAFFMLWINPVPTIGSASGRQEAQEVKILLCFDLSRELKASILSRFQEVEANLIRWGPFALYGILMESVTARYDEALWAFREPIRKIEKERHLNRPVREDRDALLKRYEDMHELARHVIHSSEVLRVACKTLLRMVADYDQLCQEELDKESSSSSENGDGDRRLEAGPRNSSRQVADDLRYHAAFLDCLQQRSQSFDERLRNEIKLAFNCVAAHDSYTATQTLEATQTDSEIAKDILAETRNLLKESRDDSKSLTKTVSILTLLFLPGTFISGFFSMQSFGFSAGDGITAPRWSVSNQIWIFFVVTIPVTVFALTLWGFSHYYKLSPLWRLKKPKRLPRRLTGLSRMASAEATKST